MFILVRISERVELPPGLLKLGHEEGVRQLLNMKYSGVVLLDHGYCVCVFDLVKFHETFIREGNLIQVVEFRVIVFQPQTNETIIGKIIELDEHMGLKISLNFFSNIFIPKTMMPQGSVWIKDEKCWSVPLPSYDENNNNQNNGVVKEQKFGKNQNIKFHVQNMYFTHSYTEAPKMKNEELVRYQLMNQTEKKKNQGLLAKKRAESLEAEISSKPPDMYVIGNLRSAGVGHI